MTEAAEPVTFELYTSAFCGACHVTRRALARAQELTSRLRVEEYDVASHPDRAAELDIQETPTVVIRGERGAVTRLVGVPSVPAILHEVVKSLSGGGGSAPPPRRSA